MKVDENDSLDKRDLENLPVLRGIELESVRGALEDCPVRRLKPEEVLIHAEQPNEFLYLLLSGRLRIHLKLALDPITVLEPGEVVGELSLIDRQLTSAYVVAEDECRVLVLDEETMWSLVDASPVARNLLFVLAGRLRHADSLISVSQQLQRRYQHYAITDALTGLYNRRWLDDTLARQMERSKTGQRALSLLLMDIDGFKKYNDTHGHVPGDCVLYTVARTLREGMRPGEIITRYGGDEFIALLPDTDASTGQVVAERVRGVVAKAEVYSSEGNPLPSVTISVGVAEMIAGDTPETFIAAADAALYDAKEEGGNRVSKADRAC
ncbi:GGDEF domain-containing protein [Acidobacteria bacterium AH-259-G07]|nr:GGDEF domain-containing protein [Acidobacteria bacterium AH-259-G07]